MSRNFLNSGTLILLPLCIWNITFMSYRLWGERQRINAAQGGLLGGHRALQSDINICYPPPPPPPPSFQFSNKWRSGGRGRRWCLLFITGFQPPSVLAKGVGPSTTLACPGWKQPDIPVEVDTMLLHNGKQHNVTVTWRNVTKRIAAHNLRVPKHKVFKAQTSHNAQRHKTYTLTKN